MNEDNLKRERILENDRLFLTPRTMADWEDLYAIDCDDEICYLDCRTPTEQTPEEYRDKFDKTFSTETWLSYVIISKETGEFIGTALVYHIDKTNAKANWGILISKRFWRQGIGTEVGQMIIRYAFEQLGVRKLCCGTHSGNTGSQRLQEKLGFVREGVLREHFILRGEPHDDIRYGMLREEWSK